MFHGFACCSNRFVVTRAVRPVDFLISLFFGSPIALRPKKSKFLSCKSLPKGSALSNSAIFFVNLMRKAENIGTDILQLFKNFGVWWSLIMVFGGH